MSFFKELGDTIAGNLKDYGHSAYKILLETAKQDISGLSDYYIKFEKNDSILGNNLIYIEDTFTKTRKRESGFKYYFSGSTKQDKPILVSSSESGGFQGDKYKSKQNGKETTIKNYYGQRQEKDTIQLTSDDALNQELHNLTVDTSSEIVNKTRNWFQQTEKDIYGQRFHSLISRFHTDSEKDDWGDTATSKSKQYGQSRGRNLLKKEHGGEENNGYTNPYCRVWTWHHQYHRYVGDTMRPLIGESGTPISYNELNNSYNWNHFRSPSSEGFIDGGTRLEKYGSMYDNGGQTIGLVNITPSWATGRYNDESNVSVRHCMFSIENLAWKGVFQNYDDNLEEYGLSREQKGPLGGRIMWFPPYGLSFSENNSANWEQNMFIGRGEPIYTYSNTTRGGTLTFKLLIDHPAILDYWDRKDESWPGASDVDDVDSPEQQLLRFFAGCDILKATKKSTILDEDPITPGVEPPANPDSNYIEIPVFFPNNYSGVDDLSNNNFDPILYLLNGIGAQKQLENEQVIDIQPSLKKIYNQMPNLNEGLKTLGGYELREEGGLWLSSWDRENINVHTEGSSLGNYINITLTPQNSEEKKNPKKWFYRVDKKYITQIFQNKNNYKDIKSYQLNGKGCYEHAQEIHSDKNKVYSLVDAYVAFNSDAKDFFRDFINEDKIKALSSIISGEQGKITKIEIFGCASQVGYAKSNHTLSKNRAKTLETWIKERFKDTNIEVTDTYKTESPEKRGDVNDLTEKLDRRAIVKIYYQASSTEESANNGNSSSINSNHSQPDASDSQTSGVQSGQTSKSVRYDDEAKFFTKLKANDPVAHKLITDKIKFFNPSFHSMTPEGFNSRLTFLNQCMRQGPTISSSDSFNLNANNLSFGRPPVCVLRIGDFYNTKVIFTSLNISYDPLTWDLNQEGIGVMPMIADVNMSFNFIGGSELGGPIERLQNAISFNYYANTSVYDNRAEEIEYGDFGTVEAFKAFIPNVNADPNATETR